MHYSHAQKSPSVRWFIDRAKFVFEDTTEYRRWMRDKQVYLKFDPTNSMDSGDHILQSPGADSAVMIPLTPGTDGLRIEFGFEGPTITADVDLPVSLNDGVDEDALEFWAEELAGYMSVELILGGDDVYQEFDHGTGFRLVENADTELLLAG